LLDTKFTANIKRWLFEHVGEQSHQQGSWWNVMCLTGVDCFSSLGFAPAMAFLFAGTLSPFATLLLVILNLFGAYPMYARVAELSPNGQGSSFASATATKLVGQTIGYHFTGICSNGFYNDYHSLLICCYQARG